MEKPKIRDKLVKKKNYGSRNRTAGHNYERQLAKEFRELFDDKHCQTSRYASRLLDDCKVDLDSSFLNVQAKNVKDNIKYKELIFDIKALLTENIPHRAKYPVAVFHKRDRAELVILEKKDFYIILSVYKKYIDEQNGDREQIMERV